MCGIIGYVGWRENVVQEVILPGLGALLPRGYDSAGIAAINDDGVVIAKTVGRPDMLAHHPKLEDLEDICVAIGHTRWATHGAVTENNAHPHADCNGEIFVVHNGIITNYKELREMLQAEGHTFQSETDSEVLAHLIEKHLDPEITLEETVRKTLIHVQGTYGLVVMSSEVTDELVIASHGSPILIGHGEGEKFVASLEDAFSQFVRSVTVLKDGEIGTLTQNDYLGNTQERIEIETIAPTSPDPYKHFMLKEIHEQPHVALMATGLGARVNGKTGTVKLGGLEDRAEDLLEAKHLRVVACGTAFHAAEYGAQFLEVYGSFDSVHAVLASEANVDLFPENTAVLAVSQSGETYDTLRVIQHARRKDMAVFSIVNLVGKSIARETQCGVYPYSGPEMAVASTKAFTGQVIVLLLMNLWFGRSEGGKMRKRQTGQEFCQAITALPDLITKTLGCEDQMKVIAEEFKDCSSAFFIGRSLGGIIAREGALKLKEVAYVHAEGMPAGELKHGSIALIDENFPVVVVIINNGHVDDMTSSLAEVKARGAKTIVIAETGIVFPEGLADEIVWIPKAHFSTAPLLAAIPLQFLAYYAALARGVEDPDKPKNLAKSVTVP